MSIQELELPLFQARADDPNVQWLVDVLDQVRGWMTAAQISVASAGRLDDRQIRSLASAAARPPAPRVISGQRGYRHIDHSTLEEIIRAAAWMESQSSEMSSRALSLRHYVHRRAH